MLLKDPQELKAIGEAKFTLNTRASAAGVTGNTAECTRSDEMVGLGIVQAIQKASCPYSDAQCHTNPPQARIPTLAACDELKAKFNH